ncbi:MAG: hypothetical protein ACOX64_06545 [Candidatus Merdivicinus sp.]
MRNIVKSSCVILAILYILIVVSGCGTQNTYSESRHQYQISDRKVLSKTNSNDDALYIPRPEDALLYSAVAADAIIIGSVKDSGTTTTKSIVDEFPDLTYTITTYQIQVLDIWYGEVNQNEIELIIRGDLETVVTKPLKDDVLVLFLSKYEDSPYLLATGDELSMYAINPPENSLYSFSDDFDTVVFDNQDENSLKTAIKSKLSEFKNVTDYSSQIGDVGMKYLSPELESLFQGNPSSSQMN